MTTSILLLLIYLIIPGFVGYAQYLKVTPRERVWYRARYEALRRCNSKDYATALFIITTAIFFLMGISMAFGLKYNTRTQYLILALNCLTALIYLFYDWQVAKLWTRYGTLVKILLVPLTITIATLSKVTSDAAIAELSGLAPQDLPGAQLFITLILTPIIWFVCISLAAGWASLLVMPALFITDLVVDFRRTTRKTGKQRKGGPSNVTALVAFFIFAIISLTIMQRVISKNVYEPRLRQAIAFSAFHLPTTYCGLPEAKSVYVAAMSDGRAALAIPDHKGAYNFEPIVCKPVRQEDDETRKLLGEIIQKEKDVTGKASLPTSDDKHN